MARKGEARGQKRITQRIDLEISVGNSKDFTASQLAEDSNEQSEIPEHVFGTKETGADAEDGQWLRHSRGTGSTGARRTRQRSTQVNVNQKTGPIPAVPGTEAQAGIDLRELPQEPMVVSAQDPVHDERLNGSGESAAVRNLHWAENGSIK